MIFVVWSWGAPLIPSVKTKYSVHNTCWLFIPGHGRCSPSQQAKQGLNQLHRNFWITVPWLLGRLPGAGIQPHQPLRPTALHCLMIRALPLSTLGGSSHHLHPNQRLRPSPSIKTQTPCVGKRLSIVITTQPHQKGMLPASQFNGSPALKVLPRALSFLPAAVPPFHRSPTKTNSH